MGCFCQESVAALDQKMQKLKAAQSPAPAEAVANDLTHDPNAGPDGTDGQQIEKLARWVQSRLPETPFEPDPAWTETELPPAPLEPAALSTLSALAQAQSQILDSLGTDVLQPAPAKALTRIIATLNARDLNNPPDPRPFQALAAQATQLKQVEDAAAADLFTEKNPPESYDNPAGQPLAEWRKFFRQVKALAPLLAVAQQFGVDLADPQAPAKIAEKLRPLRQVALPPLNHAWPLSQYTALAQALADIEDALGVDPLENDPQEIAQAIKQRQKKLLSTIDPSTPPPRPPSVANLVTPEVVKALQAVNPETLKAMNWKVPPMQSFPLLTSGLPAVAFIDQMRRLDVDMVKDAPCGRQCDAAATMRALDAAPQGGQSVDGQYAGNQSADAQP